MDVERDVIDRTHFSARFPAEGRFAMGEHFRQIPNFKQRHIEMLAVPRCESRVSNRISDTQELFKTLMSESGSIFQNMERVTPPPATAPLPAPPAAPRTSTG